MKHREWVKQRRQEKIRQAQEVWKDEDYGIKISETRRGLRLVWDQDRDPLVGLLSLDYLRRTMLAQLESELVVTLRAEGLAWDEIGWALGVSRDAVRKRHPSADRDAQIKAAAGEVDG